jgi:hypothetical protein
MLPGELHRQEPLVFYAYWRGQHPNEPHIGYGSRRTINKQGMTGLALSGSIFGLFVSFEFVLPVLSVFLIWWTFSPVLHNSHSGDTGWYEIDEHGTVLAYLGRTPPKHIRGRIGVRREIFLQQMRLMG